MTNESTDTYIIGNGYPANLGINQPFSTELSHAERLRVICEVVKAAGESGICDTQAFQAFERMDELCCDSALFTCWKRGYLSVGWDSEKQELTWRGGPKQDD